MPAFPNAYKNISEDVFKKTYVALLLYCALRLGLQQSSFASYEELRNTLSDRCRIIDSATFECLCDEWKYVSQEDLDSRLYQYFRDSGVFHKVFVADNDEIEKWFRNFIDQTYEYALKFTQSTKSFRPQK